MPPGVQLYHHVTVTLVITCVAGHALDITLDFQVRQPKLLSRTALKPSTVKKCYGRNCYENVHKPPNHSQVKCKYFINYSQRRTPKYICNELLWTSKNSVIDHICNTYDTGCIYGDEVSWCGNVIFSVEDCNKPTIGPFCCRTCALISLRAGFGWAPGSHNFFFHLHGAFLK